MTKNIQVDLDLQKKSCESPFLVKQQSAGTFIEGFANKATIDRGDEMISTDAWELENFKRNPVILFNHGMDTLGGTPVGKATAVNPTDEGLFLKVKMSNSQSPGIKMVRDLVEERILKAFSVGFNAKETDTVDVDGKSVRKINKAELFEVSIVGVPMNQDSLFELSEKALTTKSFHELKGEILKAKGATTAIEIEEKLGNCASRKDVMGMVAKMQGLELEQLLDMLAGDADIPEEVAGAFEIAVKAVDLKETLAEAMASLDDGEADQAVIESLLAKLKPDEEEEKEEGAIDEEEEEESSDDKAEDEEEEESGEGEEDGDSGDSGEESEDSEGEEDDPEDAKRKADFQECVNSKIPKLLEEGMEQDQAVAAAISKCQEEGKCCLTPESKNEVMNLYFNELDKEESDLASVKVTDSTVFKAVDEEAQEEQPPTTPIKTEPNEDNFGSPHLEAAKQTNVLLGALINEFQKFNSNLASLTQQNSVNSEEEGTKEDEKSSDTGDSTEEDAEKRLDSLNQRLKNLGY